MGSPYLNPNESIILATHRIVVKSVSSDVILTNQRLLMVDSQNSRFLPVTIHLPTIEAVMAAESATGEPEITLSIAPLTKDEATQTVSLTFSQWEAEEREHERDDWLENLKKQIVLAREEARNPVIPSPDHEGKTAGPSPDSTREPILPAETEIPGSGEVNGTQPDETGVAGTSNVPVTEQETTVVTAPVPENPAAVPLSDRFHPQAPAKTGRSPVFIAGVIVILAVVMIGAVFVMPALLSGISTGQGDSVVTTPPPTATPTPAPTPAVTVSPTLSPSPTPTPEATLPVTRVTPQFVIPETGVWVHVTYNGNYTGSYGTSGRMRTVSSSGNHFYNIPAVNETVEAAIQKADSSGNTLVVEVYKNGKVAGRDTTSAPQGYVDLHANLAEL